MPDDIQNPNYPSPSRQQLAREKDRAEREAEAAKDMQPIDDVFAIVKGAADHLRAVMATLPPKAAYRAEFHAGGLDDWLHDASSDICEMVKQYHGVDR